MQKFKGIIQYHILVVESTFQITPTRSHGCSCMAIPFKIVYVYRCYTVITSMLLQWQLHITEVKSEWVELTTNELYTCWLILHKHTPNGSTKQTLSGGQNGPTVNNSMMLTFHFYEAIVERKNRYCCIQTVERKENDVIRYCTTFKKWLACE